MHQRLQIKVFSLFPIFLSLFLVSLNIRVTVQISVDEFLSLTYEQKLKLDEFRELISPSLPHEYMKKDVFLIRWLRDRNFNVAQAEKRLLDHVQWRKENNIDSILSENWEDFNFEYRVHVEGCDKEDKPVVSIFLGDWDIRKAVVTGQGQRLMRYIDKFFEEAQIMVTRMQESGQVVTQATVIVELKNFNLVTHACPRCIPIYLYVLSVYERQYPGFAHRIMLVNMPQIALPIWNIYKHMLSPQTASVVAIYGNNKKEWQRILLKEINKNQLSRTFGGIKDDTLDYSDFRLTGEVFECSKAR